MCHDSKIAHYLLEEKYITMDIYEDVTNSRSVLTEKQRGRQLMKAVIKKVKNEPENYKKFVGRLGEDVYYHDVVAELDKEYKRLESAEEMSNYDKQ